MSFIQKVVVLTLLYILTIMSGFWLSHFGKPLNQIIMTLHKLIALASVIYSVVIIRSLLKNIEFHSLYLFLFVLSGIFVIILFVSGALLSREDTSYHIFSIIHLVTPFLTLISAGFLFYYLFINQR